MRCQKDRQVIAFHGCDESVAEAVIQGRKKLFDSKNKYDWLGSGIYFWENDWERAFEFAQELKERPNSQIKKPSVVGAIINLGYCLDLTTRVGLLRVEAMYSELKDQVSLPENKKGSRGGANGDIFLRDLDCFIIEALHKMDADLGEPCYDSVRAGFWEGDELYPNAGFRKKNHIQLCVRREENIIGYFRPIP